MAPVVVFVLLALPLVEIWAAIEVASHVGIAWTILLLIAMSFAGVVLTKREGISVWRSARAELAEGRTPTASLLDGALVVLGGIFLTVPGFVTGVFGALLLIPPVRALLRPLLAAWAARKTAKAVRSGRLSGIYFGSTVGADGRAHTYSGDMSDIIDAEGWDVGGDQGQRPLPGSSDDGPAHG